MMLLVCYSPRLFHISKIVILIILMIYNATPIILYINWTPLVYNSCDSSSCFGNLTFALCAICGARFREYCSVDSAICCRCLSNLGIYPGIEQVTLLLV